MLVDGDGDRDRTRNSGRDSAAEDLLGTHRVLHVPDDSRLLYQSLGAKRGTLLSLSLSPSLPLSLSECSSLKCSHIGHEFYMREYQIVVFL